MLIKEFIDYFRTDLYNKLNAKTGWGRNEIISLVEKSISDTLALQLDQTTKLGKQIRSGNITEGEQQ